ncbi:MAG: 4Fe-4S ferredoxin [Bacteroidales bacterium]|nr:4Fe-4S ferredoxin [Bacteroidales bacterium]
MKRTIINIDEEKCDGCALCIPNCHEGALQIVDGKARLISDLFCDGLGACIGHCPQGAITMEEREAEPYNETKVMEQMVDKGRNTILAHLEHLRDHKQDELLREAITYIRINNIDLSPEGLATQVSPVAFGTLHEARTSMKNSDGCGGGCPGSSAISFDEEEPAIGADEMPESVSDPKSELRQWPVQLHLLNPAAPYFKNADVLLAADCSAFTLGSFHRRFLKGKILAIACPKLDSNQEAYVEKLIVMIRDANINTLTVMIMEVPCCGGLQRMAQMAVARAGRNIPIKLIVVGIKGEVLKEEWI